MQAFIGLIGRNLKMKWVVYCCVCFLNVLAFGDDRVLKLLRRNHNTILGAPRYREHLPRAEPILPGHTLLQPTRGMLKSAIKYPLRDTGDRVVYGNLKNLGITYGKSPYRILYTNFRRSEDNYVEDVLLQALNNINRSNNEQSNSPVIVIEIRPQSENILIDHLKYKDLRNHNFRRSTRTRKEAKEKRDRRKRERQKMYSSSSSDSSSGSSSSSSESSDMDKNPGNPFTLHKGRYKQNWPWNHFMDGDHVNISPHSPSFKAAGPSGVDLFLGRKWWYFNQDDFKPMG